MLLRRTSERCSDSHDVFPSMNSSPRVILRTVSEREGERKTNGLCPDPSLVMAACTTRFHNPIPIGSRTTRRIKSRRGKTRSVGVARSTFEESLQRRVIRKVSCLERVNSVYVIREPGAMICRGFAYSPGVDEKTEATRRRGTWGSAYWNKCFSPNLARGRHGAWTKLPPSWISTELLRPRRVRAKQTSHYQSWCLPDEI